MLLQYVPLEKMFSTPPGLAYIFIGQRTWIPQVYSLTPASHLLDVFFCCFLGVVSTDTLEGSISNQTALLSTEGSKESQAKGRSE